jgi:hypothetical protein
MSSCRSILAHEITRKTHHHIHTAEEHTESLSAVAITEQFGDHRRKRRLDEGSSSPELGSLQKKEIQRERCSRFLRVSAWRMAVLR